MKRKSNYLITVIIVLVTVVNLPAQNNCTQKEDSKIVDADWLANHLNDPELVIVHVASLKLEYEREHIPGARYLFPGWLTISTPDEATTSADLKDMKEVLELLGISNKSKIVLTFMNGILTTVCRVYLTLDYLGLGDQAFILNGGVEKWKEAGKPVVTEIPLVQKGKFSIVPDQSVIYSTDQVYKNMNSTKVDIIDSRSAPFYEGKSGGPRYGHIPGSKNIPIAKLYDNKNIFLNDDKLREVFINAGVNIFNELITYCFVGNAASIVYFVARQLGYKVHLYDGSMDEWGNRFELPLEKIEIGK
ncbi:MAG: rhodanese-like domain-containing protein [bacterium]